MKKIIFLTATVILLVVCIITLILLIGRTENRKKEGAKLNLEGSGDEMKVKYNKITSKEAKEIIDDEDVIILDVRTLEEYEEEHIEGALLIPGHDLEDLAENKLPDKDAKILVYCRSGNRSKSAAKTLINMGYSNIYDFGGINSWTHDKVKGN